MDGHRPFARSLFNGKENHFFGSIFVGKYLALVHRLAHHAVEGFDGVSGVDGFADVRRVSKEGVEVFPVVEPRTADLWVFVIPAFTKLLEGVSLGLRCWLGRCP